MYNDVNRADILNYFKGLVASDPRLSGLSGDLGIIALGNELGYKIDDALNRNTNKYAEFYDPNSETILLSELMYKIGYLRMQKPLVIQASVKSGVDVTLYKDQRFTSGTDVFLLDDSITLTAGVAKTLTMTLGTKREINAIVDNGYLYYYIPLQTTYRKIYGFNVYRGTDELEYSQAFITKSSDVSLEVDINGNIRIVVRIGNTNGKNVSINDSIRVELFETYPNDEIPGSIAPIGDFDIICTDISKFENYEPYLSTKQMSDILKYDKNINNSIVYNENYKNLIKEWIRGISLIKVWQQEEEDNENGALACNINKVFVSFISDGSRSSDLIKKEITYLVNDTVYGRFVEHRNPLYVPISITIDIINNTKKSIQSIKLEEIKTKLSGNYDDIDRILTSASIYRTVIDSLNGTDIDIGITMTDKPAAKNATFYNVDTANITINVTERF